mgnify:CR=1 FL=1
MLGDSPENPIRCSQISDFAKCTMRIYLVSELLEGIESVGGVAAQTGSLTHVGVAEFHRLQAQSVDQRRKAAWDAIAASRHLFPQADLDETRLFLTPYMNDPRNINAVCVSVEETFNFTLEPHDRDESRRLIYLQGTVDQIRNVNGSLFVYDLKTGKPSGWDMIHQYAYQFAGYVFAANSKYQNVEPGAIIRNYGYRARSANGESPDGIFWHMPFNRAQCSDLLDTFRLAVAMVRNGEINFGPGNWCSYCEFQGLQGCMGRYQNLTVMR